MPFIKEHPLSYNRVPYIGPRKIPYLRSIGVSPRPYTSGARRLRCDQVQASFLVEVWVGLAWVSPSGPIIFGVSGFGFRVPNAEGSGEACILLVLLSGPQELILSLDPSQIL